MWLLLILAVALILVLNRKQGGGASQGSPQYTPAASSNPLDLFTAGWANAEGYNVAGSRAQRNNNPVNLVGGNYTGVIGQDAQGFDIFDSAESGWAAARGYVQRNANSNPGWSFQNFFGKVLGNLLGQPVDNSQGNSDQEAANVAGYIGVAPDTNLNDYLGGSGS